MKKGFLCGKVIVDNSINIEDKLDEQNYTTDLTDGKSLVNVESLQQYIQDNISIYQDGSDLIINIFGDENTIDICDMISNCKVDIINPSISNISFPQTNCCNNN